MVEIEYRSPDDIAPYLDSIWELLCECDQEFIPSLSSRGSDKYFQIKGESMEVVPSEYFWELQSQHFILAFEEGILVAFTTFKHQWKCEGLEHLGPTNYVTTTCVSSNYRNQGLGSRLYRHLEEWVPSGIKLPHITRKTWSTNKNQIHVLEKLGYRLELRLYDHRGPGIDTIYYSKPITSYISA